MPETIDPIALAAIAQQLAPGATVLRAWPLRGGISAQMTAVELALPNAATRRGELRRVIVRQPGDWALREYPQAARREFRVLEIAREVGAAAPAPLLLD